MDRGKKKILLLVILSLALFGTLLISVGLKADEMTHKFKNPSFSGVGTSSHYSDYRKSRVQ
jgi:hypothetical protein